MAWVLDSGRLQHGFSKELEQIIIRSLPFKGTYICGIRTIARRLEHRWYKV
jgi:hypothetical protein